MLTNPVFVRGICGDDTPAIGTSNDEQYRAIRRGLLATPFETSEREIRQLAARSLTGTDFDPARDLVAICVNRWSHGFATGLNDLFAQPLAPGAEQIRRATRRESECQYVEISVVAVTLKQKTKSNKNKTINQT